MPSPQKGRHLWFHGPERALGGIALVSILLVIVVVFVIASSNGSRSKPGSANLAAPGSGTGATTSGSTATSGPAPSATPGKAPGAPTSPQRAAPPQTYQGSGDAADTFTSAGGLEVFTASTTAGAGTFVVDIDDSSGQRVDNLVSVNAPYSGSIGEYLAPGSYRLNIQAGGPWAVTVGQPRNRAATPLPVTLEGTGDVFVGPFAITTAALRVDTIYTGTGSFTVALRDSNGNLVAEVLKEDGIYLGAQEASHLSAGSYYIQVRSGGKWTLKITKP